MRFWGSEIRSVQSMKIKIIRGGILLLALLFIAVGIGQKGFTDIKNKAIRICYECIGIG